MEKLKPCPFCGEEVAVEKTEDEDGGYDICYDICCYGDGCFRPINNFPMKSKKLAIKLWNKRNARKY